MFMFGTIVGIAGDAEGAMLADEGGHFGTGVGFLHARGYEDCSWRCAAEEEGEVNDGGRPQ
jgi:hypothetical protein